MRVACCVVTIQTDDIADVSKELAAAKGVLSSIDIAAGSAQPPSTAAKSDRQ